MAWKVKRPFRDSSVWAFTRISVRKLAIAILVLAAAPHVPRLLEDIDYLTKKIGQNYSRREKAVGAQPLDYFSIMLEIIPKLLISILQDGMAPIANTWCAFFASKDTLCEAARSEYWGFVIEQTKFAKMSSRSASWRPKAASGGAHYIYKILFTSDLFIALEIFSAAISW